MSRQADLFGDDEPTSVHAARHPDGFRYRAELMTLADEATFLAHVRELHFRDFEFHGYTGKRRVVSFGWHYDFGARQLRKTDDMPAFLADLRVPAAAFAGMAPESLQHVLITEYPAGAGIGWHRDKADFGEVGADGVGAQHCAGGCASLFGHLSQSARGLTTPHGGRCSVPRRATPASRFFTLAQSRFSQ